MEFVDPRTLSRHNPTPPSRDMVLYPLRCGGNWLWRWFIAKFYSFEKPLQSATQGAPDNLCPENSYPVYCQWVHWHFILSCGAKRVEDWIRLRAVEYGLREVEWPCSTTERRPTPRELSMGLYKTPPLLAMAKMMSGLMMWYNSHRTLQTPISGILGASMPTRRNSRDWKLSPIISREWWNWCIELGTISLGRLWINHGLVSSTTYGLSCGAGVITATNQRIIREKKGKKIRVLRSI